MVPSFPFFYFALTLLWGAESHLNPPGFPLSSPLSKEEEKTFLLKRVLCCQAFQLSVKRGLFRPQDRPDGGGSRDGQ